MKLTFFVKQASNHLPKREVENLVVDALGIERSTIYLNPNRILDESELRSCNHFLERRLKGEPLAYIKGEVEFYGCTLFLTKDVLIPRQETELLVDLIIKELIPDKPLEVWDVCTGSGCIGIALKKACPFLNVTLSDICPKALAVARKNALFNGVDVSFLEGDLLKPFQGKKCDLFISNPPYIAEEERPFLERDVKEFEPSKALFAKESGLYFYKNFSENLPSLLKPQAKVYFEIGSKQEKALFSLFSAPLWKNLRCVRDLADHPRFFSLEIE